MGVPGGGGRQPPPRLLGKQSQSGNIRFTVGQYRLIIKINGTNSVNFVGDSVNFVGNMLPAPPPPRRKPFWKVSPENFFSQLGHNPKKSGKFIFAPLIFSFSYANEFMSNRQFKLSWLEIQYSMRFDLQAPIYINCGFA